MGIAEWTTYSGTNSLELYAESKGMEWNDLELQCMAIDATLHNQNPYSGWYDTGMGKYYGVTKADFWEGDLYDATMAFFCCFEDPEEYPGGCNNHGYSSGAGCLSVSFDCGNGHGRLPYAQMYLNNMESGDLSGDSSLDEEEDESDADEDEEVVSEEPVGGMEILLYLQGNYASVAWGDTNLAKSGCGPTSLAMVMTYLNYIPCTNRKHMGIFSSSSGTLRSRVSQGKRSGKCSRSIGKWLSNHCQRAAGQFLFTCWTFRCSPWSYGEWNISG